MNKDLENSNVNEAPEIKLAENAFRELKPGEEYNPIMSSDINPREPPFPLPLSQLEYPERQSVKAHWVRTS